MPWHPDIVLVHAGDQSWADFIDALAAADLKAQAITSPAQATQRILNQPPDVVLLDGQFAHGVDLLLKTRQTVSGVVIVIVRKARGSQGLYDATLPGESPRYLEPAPPQILASQLRESLLHPPASPWLEDLGAPMPPQAP